MGYNLLSCERDQSYLMPPSMRDWLREGHLAWFIVDAVGQMDLRGFYAVYRSDGWGAAAYDPGMMVAILLYAYCLGLRSSRRIARALEEDVGFRVVAANRQPDFRTICRFRAEQEEALEELFVEVLRLCHEAGLVKLGVVALDGTKVAANAALATNRSHQAIEEEVQRMLAEAKAADAEEDAHYGPARRGDELPEGLGGRRERLKRLKEAKEPAAGGSQGCPRARGATAGRRRGHRQKEAGAKAQGGRATSYYHRPGQPHHEDQARVRAGLQCPGGGERGADSRWSDPRGQRCAATGADAPNHGAYSGGSRHRGPAKMADAGYWSEANIRACSWPEMPELLIATTRIGNSGRCYGRRGVPLPKGLSPRDRMERKLLTKRGRALYKKRGVLVEPVFGQVKEGQGFRRFMRLALHVSDRSGMTHNLLKLWRSGQAPWGWA